MHEYSIVSALIEECERLAREQQAVSISHVGIKIGVLSGVEPSLLETAFHTFKLDSLCKHASLQMDIQPLLIRCFDCGHQSKKCDLTLICPLCNGLHTQVLDGEDMLLMQLELETP